MSIADTIRAEARQEGIQLGEQRGIQLGKQEGRQEGIKQIAVNMLKEGQSVEFISKVTGMPVEEVLKASSNIDNLTKH